MIEDENKLNTGLDYKPDFKRTEKLKSSWTTDDVFENGMQEDIPFEEDEEKEVGSGLVADIIEIFENYKEQLKEKIKVLDSQLKNTQFSIKQSLVLEIKRAKEELGLKTEGLTFEDYKKALENKRTPGGAFLIEIIENQTEDLEGNMKIELYPDYFESLKELEMIERYIGKIILPNFGGSESLLQGEKWQDEMIHLEKQWGLDKKEADKKESIAYKKQKDAILYNFSEIEKTRSMLHETWLDKNKFKAQKNQTEEALNLVAEKLQDVADLIHLSDTNLERTPYENSGEVVQSLLIAATTEEKWNASLTNLSLMLKLAVDVSNKEKHHIKTSLRNVYSIENQEKVVNELTVHQSVFQNKVLPIVETLSSYREEQNETMNIMLEQIAIGLEENKNQKDSKVKEIYSTTKSSSSLRDAKVRQAIEKDNARQGYHLLKRIEEQTKESGIPEMINSASFLE